MTRPLLQCSLSVQDMYKRYTTCFCRPPQRILSTKNTTSSFDLEWNGVFVFKVFLNFVSVMEREWKTKFSNLFWHISGEPTNGINRKKLGFSYNWWAGGAQRGVGTRQKKQKVGITKKKKSGWNKISTFLQIGFDRFKKKSWLFRGSNLPLVWKAGKTLGTSGKSKIVNQHFIYLFIQTILLACLNHKFIWEKVVWLAGGKGGPWESGGRGVFTESIRADSLGREKAWIIMLQSGRPASSCSCSSVL